MVLAQYTSQWLIHRHENALKDKEAHDAKLATVQHLRVGQVVYLHTKILNKQAGLTYVAFQGVQRLPIVALIKVW